jgi:hypothetical protein
MSYQKQTDSTLRTYTRKIMRDIRGNSIRKHKRKRHKRRSKALGLRNLLWKRLDRKGSLSKFKRLQSRMLTQRVKKKRR